ncbi:3-hydroxyacyl-ACP dehydratase FabZ family protein [Chryseobacterium mucoviscidosis]|uniref:3-hydroxyacyl-ACP dehydratase FabZ family protein n=1 Tax=Chryseobacterium mucoviscidosis TaxID=1945581 RepID=UPI003015AB75
MTATTALKIEELLPHRKPMLLIDSVEEIIEDQAIITKVFLDEDMIFFKGHFDGYPLLPGVILIEMMYQSCGILDRFSSSNGTVGSKPRIGKAVGIKSATFIKEAKPNDTLTIKVKKLNTIMNFKNFHAEIFVEEKLICKADLTVTN